MFYSRSPENGVCPLSPIPPAYSSHLLLPLARNRSSAPPGRSGPAGWASGRAPGCSPSRTRGRPPAAPCRPAAWPPPPTGPAQRSRHREAHGLAVEHRREEGGRSGTRCIRFGPARFRFRTPIVRSPTRSLRQAATSAARRERRAKRLPRASTTASRPAPWGLDLA